jgi:hypothetical protein
MSWGAIGAAAVGVVGSAVLGGGSHGGGGGQQQQQGGRGSYGGGGAMDPLSALMSYGLTAEQARKITEGGILANQQADPFRDSRNLANSQLQDLMRNPGSMANDPAGQWQMQQGIQATNRGIAAQHQTNSGNAQMELMQYGQGLANQQYNNRLGQLGQMASQGASPAAGAQMQLNSLASAQGGLSAAHAQLIQSAGQFGGSFGGGLGNKIAGLISGGSLPEYGALPQYSTGTLDNPTGYDTGVGGSGYTADSMNAEQASQVTDQWDTSW